MQNWIILVLACSVVGLALSRITIYIDMRYKRKDDNDDLTVRILLFRRYLVYSLAVPVIQVTRNKSLPWLQSELRTAHGKVKTYPKRERRFVLRLLDIYLRHPARWDKLMKRFHYYQQIYMHFMHQLTKRVNCEKFRLMVVYGSEDAAMTGVMTGMFCIIMGFVLQRMKQRLHFSKKPCINIQPQFDRCCLQIDFACIFRLSLGDVISTSISLANFTRKGAARNG